MFSMLTSDASAFKFDVLVEVAKEAFQGNLKEESVNAMAHNLVSLGGQRYRCCVYKEREVLRQRVRLAMGKMANDAKEYKPKQIVQVIDAACDGCTIQKIQVTDNCRKCMKKACLAACNFGAISMGETRSQIDHDKCKECGACARACPYHAIVITDRPCYEACPVQAISWNEANICQIDESRCINCGACLMNCPFGAISDMSWVAPIIKELNSKRESYAIVAPSIQGQFENCTLGQIVKSIEALGFTKCIEVAGGADAVALTEAEELIKHKESGLPMTTSCCTGFVNMLKIHFPEQYEKNKSTTVTPMIATARKVKHDHPGAMVVFIGPCVAKKQEAMEEVSACDYVLTFEEIMAMLMAKGIDVEEMPSDEPLTASNYGRNFAASGGVAAAVIEAAKEVGYDKPITTVVANGGKECRMQLNLIKFNRFKADILEGMACPGGCVAGPAVISQPSLVKGRMVKENIGNKARTIKDSLNDTSYEDIDMDVRHKFEDIVKNANK